MGKEALYILSFLPSFPSSFLTPSLSTFLQGYLANKKMSTTIDPTVGLRLGSWGGPGGLGVFILESVSESILELNLESVLESAP